MSYPSLPQNRLIVNGVDLSTQYGLIMSDNYVLDPPSPKTYVVNIPGGNGQIDLTESLTGDAAYDNRKQEFEFYVINPNTFEAVKRRVSNFLHGKSFDYKLTMDPGYTYRGRFTISSYEHQTYSNIKLGIIKITIDAEPFKYGDPKAYGVDAVGGAIVVFESGRKKVRPVIETEGNLKVIFNNKEFNLGTGSWQVNDIMFAPGNNEIYFNSSPVRNLTWKNLKDNSVTWGQFKQERLYKWYRSNGDGTYMLSSWEMLADQKWSDLSSKTWSEIAHVMTEAEHVSNIYVNYEVGDL